MPLTTLAHEPELLQQFKADLVAEGVGEAAIRKTLAILSAVLNKAVEWHRLPANPVASIRKPSAKRKRKLEPVAPEQVERLCNAIQRGRPLVYLMAYAGLRPGEALALTTADIGKRSISITKAVSLGEVGATKTGAERTVPLVAPLADSLAEIPDGLVVPREDAGIWRDHDFRNWRKRYWRPACDAVGLPGLRPYDLRHSFASLMLAEGTNPLEVAAIMGHGPQVLFSTIAELRGEQPMRAEDRIAEARARVPLARDMFVTWRAGKPCHTVAAWLYPPSRPT